MVLLSAMTAITLTREALLGLGISEAELRESTLTCHAKGVLEPLLASRGFDMIGDIGVVDLAIEAFVVLSQ